MGKRTAVESVAIYARLSLDKEGTGLGVERQVEECQQLAAGRGWTVVEVLVDNDISATTGKRRPGFERAIAGAASGEFDALVAWHTDRLVRKTADLERVIATDVDVFTVTAGEMDLSSPAGRAVARTVVAWSNYEGEQKAERQKAAARQRATMGKPWWPTRPLGFEMDGTLRREEAEALAKIYRDTLDGVPLAESARRLNDLGILTGRGHQWRASTLRPVLLNPRNYGARAYRGEILNPTAFEPIVDEGLWRRVVRYLDAPERKTGGGGRAARALLTGVMVCGKCGHGVSQYRRGSEGTKNYVCRGGWCGTAVLDWADNFAIEKAVELAPLYFDEWSEQLGVRLSNDRRQRELIDERDDLADRLKQLGELFARGTIDASTLEAGSAAARSRMEVVVGELAELEVDDVFGFVFDAELGPSRFRELELPVQRRLIRAVFERVAMMPRRKGDGSLPGVVELKPRGFSTLEEAEIEAGRRYDAHYAGLGL